MMSWELESEHASRLPSEAPLPCGCPEPPRQMVHHDHFAWEACEFECEVVECVKCGATWRSCDTDEDYYVEMTGT